MKHKSFLMPRGLSKKSDPVTALLKTFKLPGFLKMNCKALFDQASAYL